MLGLKHRSDIDQEEKGDFERKNMVGGRDVLMANE